MPNSKTVFDDLVTRIRIKESLDEIMSIAYMVIHHIAGLDQTDIFAGKEIKESNLISIDEIVSRLNRNEPIQYITGQADFYGRQFKVTPAVLIPRQETEQIISEIATSFHPSDAAQLLEIGTGSGCIAITLACLFPKFQISATDVSKAALGVAARNVREHRSGVRLLQHDILNDSPPVLKADIIVSNPPYITPDEKGLMSANVLLYEPSLALFAPEDNPMLYYEAIGELAKRVLAPYGKIFVEINARFGSTVATVFKGCGFPVTVIKKDINGKDRVVVASRILF